MNSIKESIFCGNCLICGAEINHHDSGEPYLPFKNKYICQSCYIEIIPEIYKMAGFGDGGIIHIIFKSCLESHHNRSRRLQIKNYRIILSNLLHKYKFKCAFCGCSENLTIDHIRPVSKGGLDEIDNLQILCKPCNSKKGISWNEKD